MGNDGKRTSARTTALVTALFELNEPLNGFGRKPRETPPADQPDGPLVLLVFTGEPSVTPSLTRRNRALGVKLEENLRHQYHLGLPAVIVPRALAGLFKISGVEAYGFGDEKVLAGGEIVLGPEMPRGYEPPDLGADPPAILAAQVARAYEFAGNVICGSGGMGGAGKGLNAAWRIAESDEGDRVELTIKATAGTRVITARGTYQLADGGRTPGDFVVKSTADAATFVFAAGPMLAVRVGAKFGRHVQNAVSRDERLGFIER